MFDGRNQIMYNYNNGSQYIRTGSFQICQEYCRERHWIFIKSMFQVRILKNLANTFEKKYKRIGSNPVCNFGILRVLEGLYILILLNVQGLIRFQKKNWAGFKVWFWKISSLMFVIIFGFDSTSVQRRNVKVQVEEFFSTILFYISFGIKSVRS